MSQPPARPKVYHITHVDNLPPVVAAGRLVSDAIISQQGGPPTAIGMSNIKQRRLRWVVPCHAGTHVGDYVPFYFCPRSVMLFLIHKGNHPELTCKTGQREVVNLEADLLDVVNWANSVGRRWAFTTVNASATYASFFADLGSLDQIDWAAVRSTDFRDRDVKEHKQAEFLLHQDFPWELVAKIGVMSTAVKVKAEAAMQGVTHKPTVVVEPSWYY